MKIITSFVIGVFVVLAMAIPAEAQQWPWDRSYDPRTDMLIGAITGTDGYRGGYRGYRDPYYNMYNDPRRMDPCFKAQQYYEGIRGTFHFHKVDGGTEKHFRACDPTENPIETREAGAYGGLAGASIGAVLGGKNGAMIGAPIGAGVSGYLASRKGHDDCSIVDFTPKGGKAQVQPAVQQNEAPVSNQEQVPMTQPVVNQVDPLANITWLTVNTTDFRAVVTDPNTGEKKLIPAGGSMPLHDPSGEQPYTVVLLEPGRGKSNPVPGEIRPSQDLQGWDIVAR